MFLAFDLIHITVWLKEILSCELKLTCLKAGPKEDFREHEDATSVFLKSGNFWPAEPLPGFQGILSAVYLFSGWWMCDIGRSTLASVTCYLILNQHFIPMTYLGPCDSYADKSEVRTTGTVKSIVLWNVTPWKVAVTNVSDELQTFSSGLETLIPWKWRQWFPPKRCYWNTCLQSVIS
jgi:hypothetical protein